MTNKKPKTALQKVFDEACEEMRAEGGVPVSPELAEMFERVKRTGGLVLFDGRWLDADQLREAAPDHPLLKPAPDNPAIDEFKARIDAIAETVIVPPDAPLWKLLDEANKEDAAGLCHEVENPFAPEVDNSAMDDLLAKLESVAEEAVLPDDLEKLLDKAMENRASGNYEECENPMEDNATSD